MDSQAFTSIHRIPNSLYRLALFSSTGCVTVISIAPTAFLTENCYVRSKIISVKFYFQIIPITQPYKSSLSTAASQAILIEVNSWSVTELVVDIEFCIKVKSRFWLCCGANSPGMMGIMMNSHFSQFENYFLVANWTNSSRTVTRGQTGEIWHVMKNPMNQYPFWMNIS